MSSPSHIPPPWPEKFLAWYCAADLHEEVSGDLLEVFEYTAREEGLTKARRQYFWQVLTFCNYSTIRGRNPRSWVFIYPAMFRNYLLITVRQFSRNLTHALINLFGLAIGIAACLLIALFIRYERSFDGFHTQKENLYRLCEVQSWDGILPQKVALSMYPMGPTLTEDYADIEAFTRVNKWDEVDVYLDEEKRFIKDVFWVDSSFLDLFDFPLLAGDPRTVLDAPGNIVVTETMARNLWGSTDVMGEQLVLKPEEDMIVPLQVVGIMPDAPENSHLQFSVLFSNNSLPAAVDSNRMNRWGNNWLVTYLKLRPNADIAALEQEFPAYLEKYMGEEGAEGYDLFLQSLEEVHLGSSEITHDYQNYHKFDGSYLGIFSMLGLFIVVIASINFTNLTIAKATQRAMEVGVRKTIGATRGTLSNQFLVESGLYAFTAMILGLFITALVLPYFSELSERPLTLMTLLQPSWLLSILGGTLGIGLLAGLYPALVMAGFRVIQALKGEIYFRNRRLSLQNLLVVVQFAVAGTMIVGTILTVRQLNYMIDSDPGFDRSQVVLLPYNEQVHENFVGMRKELLGIPGVEAITASGQRLGGNIHQTGFQVRQEDTAAMGMAISHLLVDHEYIDFYGIEILEGRSFDPTLPGDSVNKYIVNEAFVKEIGAENPIGMDVRLPWNEDWGQIIAVVKNFNYDSYHNGINPLVLSVQDWWHSELSIRIDPAALPGVLNEIETAWQATGTDRPFRYEFLDEHFDEMYRADEQLSKVVAIVAGLAMLVAILGLFGLVAYAVERRTKEIGIRKVLGARTQDVFWLFSKRVALLVGVGMLLASVAGWYLVQDWLTGFAYRIDIGADAFVLAALLLFGLALATTGLLCLRVARGNPADSLRYE